mmetsp:Transcript_37914/g.107221  ORF Transcript_37914/g.107221 Transcript_37914/m.107221 type:complete len:268 (-) Transcript_37914:184-987(-)
MAPPEWNDQGRALEQIRERFDSVISTDRAVTQRLHREVDDLAAELRRTQDECDKLRRHVDQERGKDTDFHDTLRGLQEQLEGIRRRITGCHGARRGTDLDSLALGHDRVDVREGGEFLQQRLESEEKALRSVHSTNHVLDQCFLHVEESIGILDMQRKEVSQKVAKEREAMRLENRVNDELRRHLQRLQMGTRVEDAPAMFVDPSAWRYQLGSPARAPHDEMLANALMGGPAGVGDFAGGGAPAPHGGPKVPHGSPKGRPPWSPCCR